VRRNREHCKLTGLSGVRGAAAAAGWCGGRRGRDHRIARRDGALRPDRSLRVVMMVGRREPELQFARSETRRERSGSGSVETAHGFGPRAIMARGRTRNIQIKLYRQVKSLRDRAGFTASSEPRIGNANACRRGFSRRGMASKAFLKGLEARDGPRADSCLMVRQTDVPRIAVLSA
jgi:hypothetical protein